MTVTAQDRVDLIRAAGLIGRRRRVLSDFEAELVEGLVLRFRDRGDRATLTLYERQVLVDALVAMSAEPPAADHPFAWLRDHMTATAWTSWIEPLSIDEVEGTPVIQAPSQLVITQAQDRAGPQIRRRFGAVAWAVRQ